MKHSSALLLAIASLLLQLRHSSTTRFRNQATRRYLDSNDAEYVFATAVIPSDYQTWYIETTTDFYFKLGNNLTEKYLDSNAIGKVYTRPSNDGPYQEWHFDGKRIINRATSRCLDAIHNGYVYTLACNRGRYQNWIATELLY